MSDEPNELKPHETAEARQRKLIRSLDKFLRVTRGTQYRMQRLVLFGEERSATEWRDHPLIQLLLERRNQYERLNAAFEVAEGKIKNFDDPEVVAEGLKYLAQLDIQRQKHLDAIEKPLEALTKDLSAAAGRMAQILGDAQSLALRVKEMEQKAQIAREQIAAKKGKHGDLTDEDIDAAIEGGDAEEA